MSNGRHTKHLNDFTDYRLTGDLRITSEATVRQVKCYRVLFDTLGKQSTILDDACRDGRITLPLSRHYKKVVGIDSNPKLIASAAKSGKEFKNTQFIHEDVRTLSFPGDTFDGVLSAFSSWGVYGEEGDKQSLSEMVRVLKPGGTFVMDWGNINARIRQIAKEGVFNENLQRKVAYELFVTPKGEAVVRTSWIDDEQLYHWICQKVGFMDPLIVGLQPGYQPDKVEAMVRTAGLKIVGTYGSYDLVPVSATNNRLIIKAVKV